MQSPTSITPDGKTVIFHDFPRRLQAVRIGESADPITLVDTAVEERNGEVSPDGRWLAYEGENTSRPGELEIYIRSFPDVDRGVWQVTQTGGMFPMWSRDGRTLFYVTYDGAMVALPVEASTMNWRAGSPSQLFQGPYTIRQGSLRASLRHRPRWPIPHAQGRAQGRDVAHRLGAELVDRACQSGALTAASDPQVSSAMTPADPSAPANQSQPGTRVRLLE